jgi:hypothetical protein
MFKFTNSLIFAAARHASCCDEAPDYHHTLSGRPSSLLPQQSRHRLRLDRNRRPLGHARLEVTHLACQSPNDISLHSDILRRIVVETVASMMVLPNKFPIQLSDEIEAIELKAPEPEVLRQLSRPFSRFCLQGVLRVHVVEAKNLMKKDIGMLGKGKSDPYAVVTLGAQEFKTKVIVNNVDPKWDFWCEVSSDDV